MFSANRAAEERLTQAGARVQESTLRQVCGVTAYSNPWWSDPRNPLTDGDTVHAAILAEAAEVEKRRRVPLAWLTGCGLVVVSFVSLIGGIGSTSDSSGGFLITVAAVGLVASVVFPFIAVGWATRKPWKQTHVALEQLRVRSRGDYRHWLARVRVGEPNLYAQIVNWEQQQQMIEQQREIAAAARAASLMALSIAVNQSQTRHHN